MFIKDLFTTLCLFTRLTEEAAHLLSVRFFLPQLFKLRYANMGGIDLDLFTQQLEGCRSFKESAWCGYWNAIAQEYESKAEELIKQKGNPALDEVRSLIKKTTTYYSVSAFPGTSPLRMKAYYRAKEFSTRYIRLFDDRVEKMTLKLGDETVEGFYRFPAGDARVPMVIVTNGLEGTLQEILFPLMKYRDSNIGLLVMEMPGTYAYKNPMSSASEAIYSGVISHFVRHPRVDEKRIAMVGVSFGAYWSARMAAVDPRLSCAVVCGAPLHYAFSGASFLGTPEIIASVLMKVAGAKNLKALDKKLSDLSFEKNDLYRRITCPLLVINGDNDTLLGTKDSEVLAMKAARGFLKLYENDDHCAMGHYNEWLDLSFEWLNMQFNK